MEDRLMLKGSWPIGQSGIAADVVELVLIDYVSKKASCPSLLRVVLFRKFVFFLVKSYGIVID
jgi:hypothetical protein